ncbi:AAA family ATPase [Jiella sp. MQZ9-1]|uniref:AAA family ATPase n=1 Tax=Jiella flava TaxID=2816857 RepID=A0A939FWZ7_9HYPH|nr:AAA family ATPase [Jiella flava]MBO0661781.1 AAA family ATPase [Jiella flava]MCD2470422.1 AAA family ATPase [Jiella flava]
MRIVRIRLKNFKAFQDVTLKDVEPYAVFVGKNGVGKSTLFDVFGFLRDCLKENVRPALQKRGGFREVVSRGRRNEEILIELTLRMPLEGIGDRTVTYSVAIGEENGVPVVAKEILKYTRYGGGKPFEFIHFENGAGSAITNEVEIGSEQAERREEQKLDSPDILAIKGLGQFQRFEAASTFRSLIENWHVSDFHVQAARATRDAGYAEHLSAEGDNLALVTQYLFEQNKPILDRILGIMRDRVPGIEQVESRQMDDGRVVLRFQDGSFTDPFVARFVSDGTIKMFAYLVLLYDPSPHPLLCVEEPENQLYPELLQELSEEFEGYSKRGGQVFVSTHSPDFLNAVDLKSIYVLQKAGGFTQVHRAFDDENLKSLVDAGDKPGELWRQNLLSQVFGK